jgi:hypothetical protein
MQPNPSFERMRRKWRCLGMRLALRTPQRGRQVRLQ